MAAGVAVEIPLAGKSRPPGEDGEGYDFAGTEGGIRTWAAPLSRTRLLEIVHDDVECGEEGVHVEHKSSVPFPWGSGSKPTLKGGHLPLKSSTGNSHQAFKPILEQIGSLTERIRDYEHQLERISKEHYPETDLLRQVEGVGGLTALTFVLSLEDPYRFEKSRSVGAYLGLVPATDQSGDRDPQKRISKEGDEMLRRLLVGSAHYILRPFGSDSDLRRHREKIASRGGKNSKKRAAVAVARKLAMLLHSLWLSAEVYEALRNTHRSSGIQAA